MTTVSLCFQEGSRISDKTRKKVLDAAREIGYVPNQFARRLRSGKSRLIGLIVTEVDTAFAADIIAGVEKTMASHGYNVLVFSTHRNIDTEKKVVRAAYEMMAEGLIVAACEEENSALKRLGNSKYPIVYVDSVPPQPDIKYVINDMNAIAKLGLDYLLDLGHRDILLVNGHQKYRRFSSFSRFEDTYRKVYADRGLQVNEKLLRYSGAYIKDGDRAVCAALDDGARFSAVFAISDIIALGVIDGLESRGYRVPDDISVLGIDDSEVSSLRRIGLSTIATFNLSNHTQSMGTISAELLLKMLTSDASAKDVESVVLTPSLIQRNSCARYHA